MSPAGPIRPLPEITLARPGAASPGKGFGEVLGQAIGAVEQARGAAGAEVGKLLSGESGELHTAVLATQRAELAFELFLQVRNKVVQAYQEVMRMQI